MFKRVKVFSLRCFLEICRDPLSYIFALGFPLVMLCVMSLINESIPPEAGMTVFQIKNLAPGIYVFALSFVMLFTCILISKDRASSFLVRLYASPMTSADFLGGYTVPSLLLAILQGTVTFVASAIVALIGGGAISFLGVVCAVILSVPSAIFFISTGLSFGCMVNDKAAPGLASIVISASSLLGGIWMDVEALGGVWLKICSVLPFYHMTKIGRMALVLEFDGIWEHLIVVMIYAAVSMVAASLIFSFKRKI